MNKKDNFCPTAKKCGACQLSNMDYDRQLRYKQAMVVKLLKRYCRVNDIIGMDSPFHYRCKATYAVRRAANGNIVTGIFRSSDGGAAITDSCCLNDSLSNNIVKYIRALMTELKIPAYDPKSGKGIVRHILVRNGFVSNEYMVVLVCFEDNLKREDELVSALCKRFKEIKTIVLNVSKSAKMTLGAYERVLYGSGTIEDTLCGKKFRISPRSFYQVNPIQTEILYRTAIEFAELHGSEKVLDAYCGIGTIGISAADKIKSLVGVERNGEAVKDARANAALNSIGNAAFFEADSAEFMRRAAMNGERFDVVFTDPPRAGCSQIFLNSLVFLKPRRVVYVSCDPQTLSRDLLYLTKNGYRVKFIQPVDMFPHTKHVETVVKLDYKG